MAFDLAKIYAHDKMDKLAQNKHGQAITGNVLTAGVVIIALLIVGFVGIMILQSTTDATSLESGDSLYASMQNLENVTGTVFSMYSAPVS